MKTRHLWLGGWGVAPELVRERLARALPAADITVLPPTRRSLDAVLDAPDDIALGGWSLGAHLLLRAWLDGRLAPGRRVRLVCPFLAFPAEAGQGGRVAATQVKFLRRWLRTDPLAALADFHRRAGLALPTPTALPYSSEELAEGLEILSESAPLQQPAMAGSPPSAAARNPRSAILFAGARDPLVDSDRLAQLIPGLTVLPGAGHDLADFVREIAAGS